MVFTTHGIDRILTFTGRLAVPLAHIHSVSPAPELSRSEIGVKVVGAGIPGWIRAGIYAGKDGLAFWDVRDPAKALMLELHDERYSRLFVEVEDPEATLALLQQALRPTPDPPA